MVDDHHAILLGGYQPGRGMTNDVHILNFTGIVSVHMPSFCIVQCVNYTCINIQQWSSLAHLEGETWPVGRCEHAATCLGYGSQPQLLVTGGRDRNDKVLCDIWLLNVQSGRWREVSV